MKTVWRNFWGENVNSITVKRQDDINPLKDLCVSDVSIEKPQHSICDKSLCGYLKSKTAKAEYRHKPTPEPIMMAIKPIFSELVKELLKKGTYGKTLNCNESFNNAIFDYAY
ncbi:hypothetical protein J6590_105824 [Homalodisca vitripennis]|nr:hypothetical protein J6590_105824 [Homalodisca vitripennis]